jgi:hypothetical protein
MEETSMLNNARINYFHQSFSLSQEKGLNGTALGIQARTSRIIGLQDGRLQSARFARQQA